MTQKEVSYNSRLFYVVIQLSGYISEVIECILNSPKIVEFQRVCVP